jgi:secondary thiamine-phosphate synthase enzyme
MHALATSRPALFQSFTISIKTERARQFIDLTDEILDALADSGIRQGMAVVASQHTTASIAVNEHEPELLKDLDLFLSAVAPEEHHYQHNAVPCEPGEHPNGHAHCQALLLNTSATIPIVDGRPLLGRYQRIFLVELDCSRPRKVTVCLLGT